MGFLYKESFQNHQYSQQVIWKTFGKKFLSTNIFWKYYKVFLPELLKIVFFSFEGYFFSHLVSFVHLVPLWVTGYVKHFLYLKSKMFILVYNIHKRHILLSTYFLEKENEIVSYNNAILLFALSTGGMIGFCVLEVVFYFLYSCKVSK